MALLRILESIEENSAVSIEIHSESRANEIWEEISILELSPNKADFSATIESMPGHKKQYNSELSVACSAIK